MIDHTDPERIKKMYGYIRAESNKYPYEDKELIYERKARVLYNLGLFDGTDTNTFIPNIEGELTREAAMKLLGKALGWEIDTTKSQLMVYEDVSDWAKPYVAKGIELGISNGISETEFGGSRLINGKEIGTWLFRNIGVESKVAWNNTDLYLMMHNMDIISDSEYNYNRGDMVNAIYEMLFAPLHNKSKTVLEGLMVDNPDLFKKVKNNGLIEYPLEVVAFVNGRKLAKEKIGDSFVQVTQGFDYNNGDLQMYIGISDNQLMWNGSISEIDNTVENIITIDDQLLLFGTNGVRSYSEELYTFCHRGDEIYVVKSPNGKEWTEVLKKGYSDGKGSIYGGELFVDRNGLNFLVNGELYETIDGKEWLLREDSLSKWLKIKGTREDYQKREIIVAPEVFYQNEMYYAAGSSRAYVD